MNSNLPKNPFCLTFGHNYFLIEKPTQGQPEVICKCCKQQFKLSVSGNIIEIPAKQYARLENLQKTM